MNTLMKLNEPKKQQGRMRRLLPNIILAIALGIIAILAVPTILMIGLISVIWSTADRIIRWIEH